MKKNVLLIMLVALLAFTSCTPYSKFLENKAVTTSEWIVPNYEPKDEIATVPASWLPSELQKEWEAKQVVVAPLPAIKPDAPKIILRPYRDTDPYEFFGDSFELLWSILSGFFPGLAAYGAIIAVLFKRPRQQFAEAFRAALPLDGKVDLKGSVVSLAKGFGMLHSTPQVDAKTEQRIDETKKI